MTSVTFFVLLLDGAAPNPRCFASCLASRGSSEDTGGGSLPGTGALSRLLGHSTQLPAGGMWPPPRHAATPGLLHQALGPDTPSQEV